MSAPLNLLTTGSYDKLEWKQMKGLRLDSELQADKRVIGTLEFRSTFGTYATATIGSACWTFKRVGFFQNRVEVRECGSDDAVAEFVNATWTSGGTLRLRGGREYRATSNLWNTKWEVQDAAGNSLVRFDYGGAFKLAAKVKITAAARSLEDLPLLVVISWYLVMMLHADAASTSASIG